jgi:hypothetical protein
MNQNLSLSGLKRKYGRFRLLVALGVLVCGCFYLGYWLGDRSLSRHQLLVETQQLRLEELYRQIDRQLQQINFLKVEMEVEKQAADHVKEQVQQLHQQNFKLQKELSFFKKIMAPELEAGGMEIDSFIIEPTKAERIYHYKIVLVQTEKRKRYAKGYIEFKIKGSLDNESQSYDISALVDKFDKKSLDFSFQYFQILEGDLILPQGFSPQTVFVSAILPTGKWQKYSRLDRQFPFAGDIVD